MEKINGADSLVFQTEKQLKEYGDKISAGNKSSIEAALESVKAALSTQDIAGIDAGMESLNKAWEAASQEMYAASGAGAEQPQGSSASTEDVTDVNYEEVK